MKTYKTRISVTMLVIIASIFLISVRYEPDISLLSGEAIIFLFIVCSFFGIKYVIDGQTLKVYYFWGIHQNIDIQSIRQVKPSRCILSSPAASLKRLAVHYNKHDVIYISPRNQEDFIEQLIQINTSIQR